MVGVSEDRLRERLLRESNLDLKKAVELMTRREAGETVALLAKEGNFESDSNLILK